MKIFTVEIQNENERREIVVSGADDQREAMFLALRNFLSTEMTEKNIVSVKQVY